jgi:SAM-dependent methyltransferase
MMSERFGSANRDYWDVKARFKVATRDVDAFVADPGRLTTIVTADRQALGDVRGRSLFHLQCHFGMDTLAWARLGAAVTGVDFSPRAIPNAIDLAACTGLAARFLESDVNATPSVLQETFDIVYTGGGALCWLPDIPRWAQAVSRMLRPGGTFYIREAHPVLWSLEDERDDAQLVIGRPYFEVAAPTRWDAAPLWDKEAPPEVATHYEWSHSLGEIIGALIEASLVIEALCEHGTCLWQALAFMVEDQDGWGPAGSVRAPAADVLDPSPQGVGLRRVRYVHIKQTWRPRCGMRAKRSIRRHRSLLRSSPVLSVSCPIPSECRHGSRTMPGLRRTESPSICN